MVSSISGFSSIELLVAIAIIVMLAVVVSCAAANEYQVVARMNVAPEPACEPALTQAPNGDLLVAFCTEWEAFPWGGVLKLTVSQDKGRTWSQPRVIWDDPDPRVTINVANGMQRLSNGDILLPVTNSLVPKYKGVSPEETHPSKIYDVGRLYDDMALSRLPFTPFYPDMKGPGRMKVWLFRSQDNGATWTKEVPDLPEPWWQFGRLLELPDGRLIMPAYTWYVESRDFGHTWSEPISLPTPFFSETNIVRAQDGTLFAILRNDGELGPRRMFGTCFSHDGGQTWSASRLTDVRGKMPDLLVLPSGRILFVVGAEGLTDGSQVFTNKERHSFCTLFISDDHGQTWKRDVAFEPVSPDSTIVPADSPVMCLLDDGRVLVVMQGIDRAKEKEGDPLLGYSVGMHIIANIIEPVQ